MLAGTSAIVGWRTLFYCWSVLLVVGCNNKLFPSPGGLYGGCPPLLRTP